MFHLNSAQFIEAVYECVPLLKLKYRFYNLNKSLSDVLIISELAANDEAVGY